jgi:predicted nucleotidyltransferase
MSDRLERTIERLRAHEVQLHGFGVAHAAVFGSVARGEDRADSDIDVLVELDRDRAMGIFDYARVKLYINDILEGAGDVVNRRTLKPLLRENILRDAVNVF